MLGLQKQETWKGRHMCDQKTRNCEEEEAAFDLYHYRAGFRGRRHCHPCTGLSMLGPHIYHVLGTSHPKIGTKTANNKKRGDFNFVVFFPKTKNVR